MIRKALDVLAPLKPVGGEDRGYRRLLRWAALPVTDRRWAAPLAAVALGFGLFAGVAIGPGAAGTFATAPFQVIEIPGLLSNAEEGGEGSEEGPSLAEAPESSGGIGGEEEEEAASSGIVPITPLAEEPLESSGEEVPSKGPAEEEGPAEPEKEELAGTVVHVNAAAGSYTVVEPGGTMSAVHAGKLPKAGAQVKVPIETLANGTLGEAGKRVKSGQRPRATLAGIVTAVDATPTEPSYVVSNRGTSALIHVHPDPSGAVPPLPALGAYLSVAVQIETLPATASSSRKRPGRVARRSGAVASAVAGQSAIEGPPSEEEPPAEEPPAEEPPSEAPPPQAAPPSPAPAPAPVPPPTCAADPAHPPAAPAPASILWQRQASGGGAPYAHSDFAGTVTAVCPATSQLLVSADDIRESGRDLLFAVPADIDPNKLVVGDAILASADIAADGTLSLKGLASNQRLKGAEDAQATQGDLVPSKNKG